MEISIYRNGQQEGPFTLAQVTEALRNSQFSPKDLGWKEGMDEWQPLETFPELHDPMPPRMAHHLANSTTSAQLAARVTVFRAGKQEGPYTPDQLAVHIRNGQIALTDNAWREGMDSWQPLSAFPEFRTITPLRQPAKPAAVAKTTNTGPRPGVGTPAAAARKSVQPGVGKSGPTAATTALKTEVLTIWALVLGILSLLTWPLGAIAGIAAILCGYFGRSRISKNPALKGSGMGLAGMITGYLSLFLAVAALIFLLVWGKAMLPKILEQARLTSAQVQPRNPIAKPAAKPSTKPSPQANAKKIASLAASARAAGFKGTWKSADDAVNQLTRGITVKKSGKNQIFKITGMTADDIAKAKLHLKFSGGKLVAA